MGHKQRERRRRDAVDAARLPDCARSVRLQFLLHFIGEPRQRRVVELIRQLKTFVAPIRCNVRRLTRKIDIVFRINLDLLGDLRCELAKARPDFCELCDRHARIR